MEDDEVYVEGESEDESENGEDPLEAEKKVRFYARANFLFSCAIRVQPVNSQFHHHLEDFSTMPISSSAWGFDHHDMAVAVQ